MTNRYASWFTAYGEMVWLQGDERVSDGSHWRVSIRSGVPAGPIVLFDNLLEPQSLGEDGYLGQNSDGSFDEVDSDNPLVITILNPDPDDWMVAWAEVEAEGDLRVAVVDPKPAPNGSYAEITARTEPPFSLAAADMQQILVTGHGRVHRVELFTTPRVAAEGFGDMVDMATLAADLADDIPEYVRSGAEEPWEYRVGRSAPRLGLPYDTRGPGRVVGPDDELARISALVHAPDSVADWARTAYGSLTDPGSNVLDATSPTVDGVAGATISYDAVDALGTACVDPGIARWLGRSGTLPDQTDPGERGPRRLYVAAVPVYRQVIQRLRPSRSDLVDERYNESTDDGLERAVSLAQTFPAVGFRGLLRWKVELLVMAMPVVCEAPPAVPLEPRLRTRSAVWDPSVRRPNPATWTHTIALGAVVPTGSVSLVATAPAWRSLHSTTVDVDETEADRLIAGWPKPTGDAVVTAGKLPAPEGPPIATTFEARLGDWIGRWGPPGSLTVAPPQRPAPPPPQPSAILVRVTPTPGGAARTSAGSISVRLTVPPATAPGSLPLESVRITSSTGFSDQLPLDPVQARDGGVLHTSFPAPATVPGERKTVEIKARSIDAAGTPSREGVCEVQVADARPVRAPRVAPRLLATTRRTNDPSVSVTLAITAQPGTVAFRCLMASERMLRVKLPALSDEDDVWSLPRTVRADQMLTAGGGARQHYMWATDEPVPVKDGTAHATIELPSGTSDVVLIKALPLTGSTNSAGDLVESVQTPFDQVQPVAVVVPINDVPPIARLALDSAEPDTVVATVTASGLDRRILGRLDGPVEARIVEVVTPLPGQDDDPVFWPEVARLPLTVVDGELTGSVELPAVGWTRAGLAVTVRYPPERTILAGAIVTDPELRATGPQADLIESPWGPFSAPVWVDVLGAEPAVEPDGPQTVSFRVTGLPELPSGHATWVASVMSGTGALVAMTDMPVSPTADVVDLGPRDPDQQYAVVLSDPFGVPRDAVML